ncbi:MAG: S24 family peptidase [Phycisphaerae bacterium]|nr:S24 family peptidase [Phycisphaerae bacterium]MDP7288860.1 S24 family peptidase [Phycisphaerae bacterium]
MRKNSLENSQEKISSRIVQVRVEVSGPDGKSCFAKLLDLSPDVYDRYEDSGTPAVDVLVRIAQVAGVDLGWLLTGQSGSDLVPLDHPALQRAVEMLADIPNPAAALAATLELLAGSMSFPAAPPVEESPADPRASWIPILGRSAAGLPQFWSDRDESAGVTTLDELIRRNASNPDRQIRSAVAATETDQTAVELITLNEPDGAGVVSFVAAPSVKSMYADAFALRIDGDSMRPDIQHGDLVILSPSAGAADGKSAVVQLDAQIGVTCKLFRRDGEVIHLVPMNNELPPQTYSDKDLVWALRVLARVRS